MGLRIQCFLVLCGAALFLSSCATHESHGGRTQYKVVSGILDVEFQQQINKAAQEGWEVVSSGPKGEGHGFAILRRKR